MQYEDFKQEVDNLGYELDEELHSYCILKDDEPLINIDKVNCYQIDSFNGNLEELTNKEVKKLFDLAIEFTSTPVEERQKTKGEIK